METASFLNESRFLACQCCHSNLSLFETPIQVTVEIKRRFFELTQVEMKTSSQSVICLACDGKLFEFSEFRCEVLRLMSESIFVKTETEAVVKIEYESEDYDALDQPIVKEYLIDKEEVEGILEATKLLKTVQVQNKKLTKRRKILGKSDDEKPQRIFSCKICTDFHYRTNGNLDRHMLTVHGKLKQRGERFTVQNMCTVCAKILKNGRKGLEHHMIRFHSDEFKFFCDICPRKHKLKQDLEIHMRSHVQIEFREKFPCETCGDIFNQRQSLEIHIIMKHSESPPEFFCDCGKTFKTKKHLKYHQREMHETALYPCEKCSSRVFTTKVKLNRHLREFHASEKPCEVCGKMLRGHRTILNHMRGHDSPEFKCTYDDCNRQFFGKIALMDHIATKHERNENFTCLTCGSTFITIRNLKKHIQRQHTSAKIPCAILSCKYSTTRKDYLTSHYRAHKDIDEEKKIELIEAIKDIRGIAW